ncbi:MULTISPECIES: hypothetical protein [unclassified Leeuwenhoekiella]|uniref:hypothetical protein n=1 Tax=unclassified Leeuwenhoekiella TaxID=2615029 RepID=UPI000C69F2ED|nr:MULTISPECIES: hypothetical protein [unclassified Leeuwenhoekiella]MBA80432.1 hypothetical protein [Leeuwenhoekiella sp.]|tara:strand:+ start:18662 stop:20425 length:1764 start_codon:yes stop_codon:yes gene_type:complete
MNLRSLIITGALLSASHTIHAQVGIGTTTPVSGALLDISATDKGLMIPRVALTGTDDTATVTPSATTGLLVFNTAATTGTNAVSQGFYYWDGSKWVKISVGSDDTSIYANDGTLASDRIVTQNDNTLDFVSNGGRNAIALKRTDNSSEIGLSFRNSGNNYDASIFLESSANSGLVIASGSNQGNADNLGNTAIFNNDQTSSFSKEIKVYEADANLNDITSRLYSSDDDGLLDLYENNTYNHRIAANATTIFNDKGLDLDFRIETDTNENTFFVKGSTNRVGIGTNDPQGRLHILEAVGTPASASAATLLLEHSNGGGESSIVFKSAQDPTDYGYLKFSDNDSGNGSTSENSLLQIGVQNDGVGSNQDDINIASSGNVGISNTAPKEKLHISGSTSTIRIDGLNRLNNANNVQNDPMPVYVDDNGTIVLQPSLVQTYMPINEVDFLATRDIVSYSGAGQTVQIHSASITLSQESLVQITYQFSVSISRANNTALTDGASRLFRSKIRVNSDPYALAYCTGTYTNNPDSNASNNIYASGNYYLSGSGYITLPAGTHNLYLDFSAFGASYDYNMTIGQTDQDRFQVVVHR